MQNNKFVRAIRPLAISATLLVCLGFIFLPSQSFQIHFRVNQLSVHCIRHSRISCSPRTSLQMATEENVRSKAVPSSNAANDISALFSGSDSSSSISSGGSGGSAVPRYSSVRNLKTAGQTAIKEDEVLQRWNEYKGLSERDIIEDARAVHSQTHEAAGSDDTILFSSSSGVGGVQAAFLDREKRALSLAYRRCEHVTQLFSKTFYMGTSLMPPAARQHVWAIYAWCRRTDDIVDSPRALLNQELLQGDLEEWEQRLEAIWAGQPKDLFDLAMSDTVLAYPSMPLQPYRDMIAGMVMDVPGMGRDRYETFDDLYLYCYRVAGTVGLMTLPILGTADGYSEEDATEPALSLGIALQLTNILRDVGEDLERGRIYLPLEELRQFGLTEEDLFKCQVTPKYKKFMQFQIARARDYYAKAALGVPMLSSGGRLAVQASLDLYSRILDVIERNDYDNFNKRAFTTKLEKLSILPQSYMKATFFAEK